MQPTELLTERWLIEVLSVMSSSPPMREAASTWLETYAAAQRRGCSEAEAHLQADAVLQPLLAEHLDVGPPVARKRRSVRHAEGGRDNA